MVPGPGVVDTQLHKNTPKEFLRTLSPLGQLPGARDIAEAVFYLTEASQEFAYLSSGRGAGSGGTSVSALWRPVSEVHLHWNR